MLIFFEKQEKTRTCIQMIQMTECGTQDPFLFFVLKRIKLKNQNKNKKHSKIQKNMGYCQKSAEKYLKDIQIFHDWYAYVVTARLVLVLFHNVLCSGVTLEEFNLEMEKLCQPKHAHYCAVEDGGIRSVILGL